MKPFTYLLSLLTLFMSANLFAQSGTAQTIEPLEKWIAFSPIILFLIILFLVFMKLKKDNVSLKDLLLDKDANIEIEEQKTQQIVSLSKESLINDPVASAAVKNLTDPTNADTHKANTSVSRFLAFISGLVSVGLACTITTFFMWNYFLCDDIEKVPDLDKLLTVLLTLGIGVVPYAFNKISTAAK